MEQKQVEQRQVELIFAGNRSCNRADYVTLFKAFPLSSIKGGTHFSLEDLAKILKMQVNSQRFRSVIAGWRNILAKSGVYTQKRGDEIIVANDSDKVHLVAGLNKRAFNLMGRGQVISRTVNEANLSEVDRKQHEINCRVLDGKRLAETKERVIPSFT